MSYDEHLISMAGGDGEPDVLGEIEARAEYFPPLLAAHSNGEASASVYEEADGLETICYIPDYYSAAAQDRIADAIVEMEADRRALLAMVREQRAALEQVKALADKWRYKGEFGWGAWQEGEGPDPEGYALDHAAWEIYAALTPADQS